MSCKENQQETRFIDWQGHRGARGVFPENSLDGFLHALEEGMVTLEMDVVISADSQVVVSHEPYINPEICLGLKGEDLTERNKDSLNMFAMEYSKIAQYDCGTKLNNRFPNQRKMYTYKPLLIDILEASEAHANQLQRAAPFYNIELKSKPEAIGISQPNHQVFAKLVLEVIKKAGVEKRTTIQSFDALALNAAHGQNDSVTYAYLYEQKSEKIDQLLKDLNFKPDVLSPDYTLVDETLLEYVKENKLQLIPWTVNDSATAAKLILLGVDGIITDYPALKKSVQ